MSKHELFILTPITSVIKEMISATACIGSGIETYPLWDYILQSTFTKMTGFQEQKMKCIDWELATNGYEYRLAFIEGVKGKGTYSTYDSKEIVYNALLDEISRYSGLTKSQIVQDAKNRTHIKPIEIVQELLVDTNAIYCRQRDYIEFSKCNNTFNNQFYVIPTGNGKKAKLFESVLSGCYANDLYRNRNRIAHNTLSYQQNLPELEQLKNEEPLSRNYFFWFAMLVLIDEIMMGFYKEYLNCLKMNSYFEE